MMAQNPQTCAALDEHPHETCKESAGTSQSNPMPHAAKLDGREQFLVTIKWHPALNRMSRVFIFADVSQACLKA